MARGHTSVKRKDETKTERASRLGGYVKDIKLYKMDTEKNQTARNCFNRPPYYLKGRTEECQEKNFGTTE